MILTYTRVPAEGFDQFLEDEDAVLAITTELQLSTTDIAALAEQQGALDPVRLFPTLEGRWTGEQSTFSLEQSWGHLSHIIHSLKISALNDLTRGGRATHIHTEFQPLRVFQPSQIQAIDTALRQLDLSVLQEHSELEELQTNKIAPHLQHWGTEEQAELWTLYPALQRFFELSAAEEHFVIVALS